MILLTRRTARGLLLLTVVLGALALLGPPPAAAQAEDDAFAAARTAYMAAETDEARLAVVKAFLADHPDRPEVGEVLHIGTYLLAEQMGDDAGAIALVENQLPLIQDAEVKAQAQGVLLDLYSKPEYAARLKILVAGLYDMETMSFVDHLTVIKAAAKANAWAMVDSYAAAAEPLATPEAFRAAYPDDDFTDDYIQEAGRNRQGLLKTYTGWSATNQDDPERARKDFKEAKKLVRKSYFGLPDNDLYRYWGETLVGQGEVDEGLEMLALAAIYGNDHEARDAARKTFVSTGKPEDGFDDYLWTVRRSHAPDMQDFSALDYQAATHSFNDLRGKKATLLAFWFPT